MGGRVNPSDLLSELQARQVELMVVGDRLRIRPVEALPPDLREELRRHKAEVVELLKARSGPGLAAALPGGVTEARRSLLAADVIAMRLDEFATARLRVEVTSDVLGERVVFASDNALLDPGEQRVVYRAAELLELIGFSPDDLRKVHSIKKLFGGTIVPS
jgi:hypothetical protein